MWDTILEGLSNFLGTNRAALIGTVVVIAVSWVVIRITRRALKRWEDKVERDLTSSGRSTDRERGQRLITISDVIRLTVTVAVVVTATLTVLAIWGVPTTAFIAVGSTIGVAVGFGAQDVVRDVIAGLLILIEDQYSIGDVVRVADVEGTVEGIKLRTTVLRDLNGNRHFVPNGQIKVASNMTSEFSRLVVDVPVSYETDLDRAIEVIIDEATAMAYSDEWEEHFLEPPTMLGVNRLADSSVEIRVLMTLASESRWLVKREFLKRIKTRLDTERIVIPYNRLRVILDQQDLDR